MADLDLSRVKRNVAKMAGMGAPIEDIDGYIASEGTTVDAVRAFKAASSQPSGSTAPDAAPAYGGAALNATAGANEALYGIAGLPVDAVRGAMNLGVRGINAVTGSDIGQIPENSFGGSRFIAETMGRAAPVLDPRNTVASSGEERVARGVGQGVAGTVLPAGILGAADRLGMVAPAAVEIGTQLVGRSGSVGAVAGDAFAGATAGAGAAAAQEVVPEEYKAVAGFAGGLVGGGAGAIATGIPRVTSSAVDMGSDFMAPLTAGGRDRLAGQQLDQASRAGVSGDPRAFDAPSGNRADLIDALRQRETLVAGSEPTTFQTTGNMGLGALERAAQTKDPVPFQDRRAEQNTARVAALDGLQPGGAPEQVSRVLKERMDAIDSETMKDLTAAQEWERGASRQLGTPLEPEVAGGVLRERIQSVRDQAKLKEKALWEAVDPDGTLALPANNARKYVTDTKTSIPASAKPPVGEEAEIYRVLGQYGDVSSFREVQALQSRVKTEMRRERSEAGETPAYARLAELNSALFRDLESAAVQKVQHQTQAVARGEMRHEDTVEAAMNRQVEAWFADRAQAGTAGGSGPTGFGPGGPVRSSAAPRLSGAAGQAGGRSGPAPSDPRLSGNGLQPTFDPAALDRLTSARDATNDRVNTFDNPTLRPMLKRPATTAPYDMRASAVPQRLFTAGNGAFEKIQTYRAAAGNDPRSMQALEGYAIDSLRKYAVDRDTGAVNPGRLENWRRAHADALRGFPELDIRIGNASDAAKAVESRIVGRKASLDRTQAGVLGKIMGAEDPQDVTRMVGSLFGRQDSVAQMGRLREVVGVNPDAVEGLRKSVADYITGHFVGNTEVGTSGQAGIKADQFQTFIRLNKPALALVYKPKEVELLEAVAADLSQANRSLTSVKIPGQSNTAQDRFAIRDSDSPTSTLAKLAIASAATGGSIGVAAGSLSGVAATVGVGLIGALRENGIRTVDELVRDALLHPDRAAMLLEKVPAQNATQHLQSIAQRYRSSAIASARTAFGDDEEPIAPLTPVFPSGVMGGGTAFELLMPVSRPRADREMTPHEKVAGALLERQRVTPPKRINEKVRMILEALQKREAA